ncbi:polyprenyl glycosylphosphotransferase [Bdellovibrio sp. qaytius]|nr:polyprenyl glycosylphosphotransferase [Bdellovibrio sp. qaytius]
MGTDIHYLISRFSQANKAMFILLLDAVTFILSFYLVNIFLSGDNSLAFAQTYIFWFVLLGIVSTQYIFGVYDFSEQRSVKTLLSRVARSLGLGFIVIGFLTFVFNENVFGQLGEGYAIGTLVIFFILSSPARILFHTLDQKYRDGRRWLFLVPEKAKAIIQKDLAEYQFKGHVVLISENELGKLSELLKFSWTAIVLGLDETDLDSELAQQLMQHRLHGQAVLNICDFYEMYWKKVPVDFLKRSWFLLTDGFTLIQNPIGLRFKRLMDFGCAALLFFVTWPFMLLAAIAIKLDSSGPVLFSQERVGKNGRRFKIYKFRSMVTDAEKNGAQWATKNDSRVTKVGAFIRATRIDELPQLINILTGDMSFVGPRPERHEFNVKIEEVVPFYNVRHLVRPGITGWAQVLFPYGASIEDSKQKLQYEIYYIKNYSILMDIEVVLKTVSVVLLGKGR